MRNGSVALEKKPRPATSDGDGFDRDRVLEGMFALPVPPAPRFTSGKGGYGRTYPIHTPLGRLMRLRGVTCEELAVGLEVTLRSVTNWLAGKTPIDNQRERLAEFFGVDGRIF